MYQKAEGEVAQNMADFKEVVEKVLLPLQLSLGLFLIMKTTPLWAVTHCTLAYLLHCFHFPYTDYKQLEGISKGRVFKKLISHATTAGGVSKVKKQKDPNTLREMIAISENGRSVSVVYLGQRFVLRRVEGDKMLLKTVLEPKDEEKNSMKDGPASAYYITDKMWETVQYIAKVAPDTVFVKNHKEIWEEVVTGDIMEFEEVMDSVILDNRSVIRLDHDYFLPVNLLLMEIKLTATLNFVALFLKTQKHIHWLIPALLTFTAVVMGFSTTLRLSIDDYIAAILCRALQWVCDLLPLLMRRRVYYWGSWLEHFRPSNDLQSKIVRGDISVLVGGGAKFHSESKIERINFPDCSLHDIYSEGGPALFRCDSKSDSSCDSVYIEWIFDDAEQKCSLKAGRVASNEARPSLNAVNTSILCGDGDRKTKKTLQFFTSDCCKPNKSLMADDTHTANSVDIDSSNAKKSLMADDIHTASVDVDCSTEEEAIKLFIFAAYMAELQSGSLRSCDSNSKIVHVRRFVESINAYVRSGYPPLYILHLQGVVVRQKLPKFRIF